MDDDMDWPGWCVDACAALTFGAAAGWSAARLATPATALVAAILGLLVILAVLRVAGRGGRRFPLPAFALAGWEEVLAAPEPLLLDTPLSEDGRVVRLRPLRAGPTPGQLSRNIDDFLAARQGNSTTPGDDVVLLGADASAALHRAFGELKRSLR